MTNIPTTVLLAGRMNQNAFTNHPDADPFWISTPIFSRQDRLYGQAMDPAGNVASFLPLDTSDSCAFKRAVSQTIQSVGQPRLLGLVIDPRKPDEVTCLDWLTMAKFCLERFPQLRPRLEANPVAAFAFAGFFTGELKGYLKHSGQQAKLNFADYDLELAEISAIADRHLRTSPALHQMSREAGLPPELNP